MSIADVTMVLAAALVGTVGGLVVAAVLVKFVVWPLLDWMEQ